MKSSPRRFAKALVWVVVGLCCLALVAVTIASVVSRGKSKNNDAGSEKFIAARLVPGTRNALELSPDVITALNLKTVRVEPARSHERLRLSGSLFLDSNRMVRVHSRFAGEVVSIAPNEDLSNSTTATMLVTPSSYKGTDAAPAQSGGAVEQRPLRLGDRVTKGQLLAVIWSKDVGEKKSDLVNALSQLYLDKAQLDRLHKLDKGAVAERTVREAERQYEADVIAVERVERTLRSWRLGEDEIIEVRHEAEKIHRGEQNRDVKLEKSWAEVDVKAPFEGIVLEKNITIGDIVDTDLDLFKIADLSTLGVLANVYEEDLPAIESLKPDQRRWTVYLKSQPDTPGMPGTFDLIGNIIDPNQHTAAVMGWLPNPGGRLRVGQFIKAVIELPAAEGEVAVPDDAVIDQGTQSTVFVSRDANPTQVSRRGVAIVRRGQDYVFLRAEPTSEERQAGCTSLRPGMWVVTGGTVELAGALENALASAPAEKPGAPKRQ